MASVWVPLRQHPSPTIRSAVYSAIDIIFERSKMKDLERSLGKERLYQIQGGFLRMVYGFRKSDTDIKVRKKLMDAFFTLSV